MPNNEAITFYGISPLNNCSDPEIFGTLGLNFGSNPFFSSLSASKPDMLPKFSLTIYKNDTNLLTLGDSFSNYTDYISVKTSEELESWGFHSRGFRFGSSYEMNIAEILIDSAESLIVAPKLIIQEIFSELLSLMSCSVSDFKYLLCNCEEIQNSPELILYLEEESITVKYSSLFQDQEEGCMFMMSYHEENHWVLGKILFHEYFLQFDYDAKEISLMKKPQEVVDEEEKPILTIEEIWIMIFTVAGCFLFYVSVRIAYVVHGWFSSRLGGPSGDIQEPLVENFDAIEIAKFRARRSEMSNR